VHVSYVTLASSVGAAGFVVSVGVSLTYLAINIPEHASLWRDGGGEF
jgi:hypothetical protein